MRRIRRSNPAYIMTSSNDGMNRFQSGCCPKPCPPPCPQPCPKPCPEPCSPCNPCPPTLPQRVSTLECEVADINVTLAEHTAELNNHECRIENLENRNQWPQQQSQPYPWSQPWSYPQSYSYNSDPNINYTDLEGSLQNNNITDNNSSIMNYQPGFSSCNPCHQRPQCGPCGPTPFCPPGRRPPIIFDGYSISFRQTVCNGTPAAFWYLIPETSSNCEVYRFSLKTTSGRYVYEPVDPTNFAIVIPASATDGNHITYIYENIPGFGWGLRPYLYLLQAANPHTILGYQYIQINFINPPSTEWCYVPLPSPSTLESIFIPYFRSLHFHYARTQAISGGITFYNTVDPTAIDPATSVDKYPIRITSPDPDVRVRPDTIPIGPGVAFLLPFDTHTYQVSFTATAKFNTEMIPVVPPQPSINYLAGSPYIGAQPAIAQLVVFQVDSSGSVVDMNPSASLQFTWANVCIDPTLPGVPPNNFKVFQEPDVSGQPGAYYKICPSNINIVYNVIPILDHNGHPFGRRLISVAVTQGFSFGHASVTITRLPL